MDAPSVRRIILLFSYEYVNLSAVHSHLQSLLPSRFLIASKHGLGRTLLHSNQYPVEPIKWTPTYSSTMPDAITFSAALLFWDGSDPLLKPSAQYFDAHHIPYQIIGPDAKVIAPSNFYATFSNGDHKMSSQPQVIVDPPKPQDTYGQSQANRDTKVRLQLSIPESIISRYEEQARAAKVPLEKLLSDRLRTCIDHTSGRGLYFNDVERAALERMTGGHMILDAAAALVKIHTTINLKVADISIELNERVLARCASRAKSERKTFDEYIRREVIQGLERSTGLRPW